VKLPLFPSLPTLDPFTDISVAKKWGGTNKYTKHHSMYFMPAGRKENVGREREGLGGLGK